MRLHAAILAVTLALPAAARAEGQVIVNSDEKATIECTQDKSEVAINGSDNTVTITGACTKIAVNGSTNKVTIASVQKLAINGSENVVDVDAAGKIAVLGADNKVTYKRGLNGRKAPKVANLGSGNTVKKAP